MFTFELVTLSGVKFGDEVYEVLLPTPGGQIAILPHHMPLVTLADRGILSIRRRQADKDDDMEHYATRGGVLEVTDKVIRLLADEADHANEIIKEEAEAALKRAHKLAEEAKDQVSLEHAKTLIEQERLRIHVAGLKKRHQRR